MANNSVVFEVIVTDKGTQKVVIKNLDELGDKVKGVGSSQKEAGKAGKDFYDTQKKGIAGTANSTKSFSKLAETIGSSSGVVGAYATLAANIFAVTAAFNALRNASQVEQVFLGLEAAGNRLGQTLSITARGLKEVTANAISTEQSLRSTAQVIAAGFGQEQVIALGKAARDTSFALGRNLTDSMDRLTRGVVKLEPELLDELGIMTKITESNTKYAATLGKSVSQLSNFEKRQGFLNAVLAEADLKFGGLADSAGNSTAYDKLAANFADLTQNVLSFINVAAKPLAAILGSSQFALGGAALLFASGISKQLLPGLADLSKNSLVAAAASKEQATQARAAAEAELKKAKAAGQAGVAAARGAVSAVAKGPKAFNDSAEAINKGTASVAEQDRAYAALTRSIKTHETQLDKLDQSETAKIATKNAMIAKLEAQRDAIDAVRNAEANAANTTSAATAKAQASANAALAATQKSKAADRAANATVYASQLKISEAYKNIASSVASYARAERTANSGAITRMGALRTAAFAASVGVRALGAAFLAALPIIGQVVFVIGLLYAGFQALKSDATKKAEQALEDFNTVLESSSGKLKEFNRVQASTAPAAQRAEQALIIQANSVNEIVDAYNSLIKVQTDYAKNGEKASRIASARDVADANLLNGDFVKAKASYLTGISQDSKILNATQENILGSSRIAALTGNKEISEVAQALEKVRLASPKVFEETVKLHGGYQKIKTLKPEAQLAELRSILGEVQRKTGDAAQRTQELSQSLKDADLAIGSFLKSAIQSTPYDDVVTKLETVTDNIDKFRNAVANGESGSENWATILQGIGPELSKMMDNNTAKMLQQTAASDAIVQSLQAQVDQGIKLTPYQKSKLEDAKDVLSTSTAQLGVLDSEIGRVKDLFTKNQSIERSLKSQLTLAQAGLDANQTNYAVTAQGETARLKAENDIRNKQAESLKAQKALIESALVQNRAKLKELEINQGITKELRSQGKEVLNNSILEARKTAENLKAQVSKRAPDWVPNSILRVVDPGLDKLKAEQFAAEKLADELQTKYNNLNLFEGIERDSRGLEASVKSLQNEIAALYTRNLTGAQIAAEAASKEVAIQNERLSTLIDQNRALESINEEYLKQGALINSRTNTLGEQLRIIKAGADIERSNSSTKFIKEKATLEAQLEIVRAARIKARSKDEIAANTASQEYYTTKLALNEQDYAIEQQLITAKTTTSELEKVIFDTRKEGLEWQQQSLEYVQRSIDAQKQLTDSVQAQISAQTKLSLKKRGLEISEPGQEALDMKAAAAAYTLAVQEVNIKKSLIDLEYALLDAQREQLREDLIARRSALADKNEGGRFDERLKQLDSTIGTLNNIDTSVIAENLKKNLDVTLMTQKTELEAMMYSAASGNNSIISFMEGLNAKVAARNDVAKALLTKSEKLPAIVKAEVVNKIETPKLDSNTQALINNNKELISVIREWIRSVEGKLGNNSPIRSLIDAAEYGKSMGAKITEMPGYGPVGKHGKNSRHYTGNAFDLNMAPGKGEINDPAISKKMDDLAEYYKKLGFDVLWKVADHFDHMHVSISENAKKAFASMTSDAGEVAKSAIGKVGEISESGGLSNSSENEIVVTAKALVEPVLDTPEFERITSFITTPLEIPAMVAVKTKDFAVADAALAAYNKVTEDIKKNLADLGPDGAVILAMAEGMTNIGSTAISAMKIYEKSGQSMGDSIIAASAVVSAALSTIQSVLSATSDAKIANIDKEISAEQRRDGKSSDSLKKIEALEKRKDQIAKKQFDTNKKIMMAQAIVSTAAGVAGALAAPFGLGIPLAILVGAMGAAQMAIIAGTSYQSAASSSSNVAASTPSSLTIGKAGDSVDLAKSNSNLGGELGYLRGQSGYGNNSSNYAVVGSAYGGKLPRGYGNTAYMVGEKGPEIMTPETPISVRPVNDNQTAQRINASISIQALDASGVEEILHGQRGNIISMLREAANANGQNFLEDVNTNVYTRPNVGRL